VPLFDEALSALRAAGDQHGVVNVLAGQTVLAAMSDDLPATQARADEFLAVAEQIGERWMRSNVLWALGLSVWRAGDPRRAADLELESMRMRLSFDDQLGPFVSTEILAWIVASVGDAQTAALLLGVAGRVAGLIGTSADAFAFLADDHARCTAQVEAELGTDVFLAATARGAALGVEQVIELVSGPKRDEVAPPPARRPYESPLTRREQEIAELVAQGVSNKEIAARLVIAPRTAEGHVEHILVKLGFTSRSQIASWVAERRNES
jgi:DNA-binding NarL/FixJ family response regulator